MLVDPYVFALYNSSIMKKYIIVFALFLSLFPVFSFGKSDILNTVQTGTEKEIKKQLSSNPKLVNYKYGDNKDTLLMIALESKRDKKIIKLLLKTDIDVNAKNRNGQTALMYACKYYDDDMVNTILKASGFFKFQRKKRILQQDKDGKCAFDYAKNSTNILEKYAVNPANVIEEAVTEAPITTEPSVVETPVVPTEPVAMTETTPDAPVVATDPATVPNTTVESPVASDNIASSTSKVAVESNPVVAETSPITSTQTNIPSSVGGTAIIGAATVAGSVAVAGAAISNTDNEVANNKEESTAQENTDSAQISIKDIEIPDMKEPYKPIYLFDGINLNTSDSSTQIETTDSSTIIQNPNKKDALGRTMLMTASAESDLEQIQALITSSANVNLQDNDGYSSLMYALRYSDNIDCVKTLVNAGADTTLQNKYGVTPLLICAAYNKNPNILDYILTKTKVSNADLHKAFITSIIQNSNVDIINVYFKHGANANYIYKGKSPLMYSASSSSDTKVISLLLKKGADPTITTFDNKNAFTFATENIHIPHDNIYWSLNTSSRN